MTNHPRVKLGRINGDNKYSVVLDMTISYKDVLQERLNRLNAFVAKYRQFNLKPALLTR